MGLNCSENLIAVFLADRAVVICQLSVDNDVLNKAKVLRNIILNLIFTSFVIFKIKIPRIET